MFVFFAVAALAGLLVLGKKTSEAVATPKDVPPAPPTNTAIAVVQPQETLETSASPLEKPSISPAESERRYVAPALIAPAPDPPKPYLKDYVWTTPIPTPPAGNALAQVTAVPLPPVVATPAPQAAPASAPLVVAIPNAPVVPVANLKLDPNGVNVNPRGGPPVYGLASSPNFQWFDTTPKPTTINASSHIAALNKVADRYLGVLPTAEEIAAKYPDPVEQVAQLKAQNGDKLLLRLQALFAANPEWEVFNYHGTPYAKVYNGLSVKIPKSWNVFVDQTGERRPGRPYPTA